MSYPLTDEVLKKNFYYEVRRLDDGIVALHKLMFTTAICVDLDSIGYAARFCFESEQKAREEINKMKSIDDVPEGWIARR